MRACDRGGAWAKSLEVFEEFRRLDLAPDKYACNTAIKAFGEAGRWEQALQTLESLKPPDVVDYNAAITACGSAMQWTQARREPDCCCCCCCRHHHHHHHHHYYYYYYFYYYYYYYY